MTKTTIIQHPEYGRVEGVEAVEFFGSMDGWIKKVDGVIHWYTKGKGWKEVLPKRDVTGEVELGRNHAGWTTFKLGSKDVDTFNQFTFTKAQAVVLPEGMNWEEWLRKYYMLSQFNLKEVLSTHTTTVIQVWQEGE